MGRAMKKTIIAAALALPLLLTGCGSAEASDGASDRFDHTGSGIQSIRIITDTETGVQYLFVADCFGYAGMGGMTVLVDADGKPLISEEADHD